MEERTEHINSEFFVTDFNFFSWIALIIVEILVFSRK